MGFPNPDLAWTNDTPYGILIWTSYTDTSVTVTLYSTQYAWGEQTGQSTGRSGNCTTVSTQRTIHYEDGRTATDSFNARYRDPGKTSC
jgi:vancomycin resistance protein YoaR